jgi:hypothetical protein
MKGQASVEDAFALLAVAGEELTRALDQRGGCKEMCFSDPEKLAKCTGCREDLANAAAKYAKATGAFREAALKHFG